MAVLVKTLDGLAFASVKTRNALAVASVKNINGLDTTSGGNWWTAGGATGAVGAYQPKGAASYAASKVNLANPGTNDAVDGSAFPSWGAPGWAFLASSSQYLTTGLTPTSAWTGLVQVASIASGEAVLFGIQGSSFWRVFADFGNQAYYGNGGQTPFSPGFASPGNIGFAGLTAYRNGASDGVIGGAGYVSSGQDIAIGCGHDSGGSFLQFSTYTCVAAGFWNNTLSPSVLAAVAAAMAAI